MNVFSLKSFALALALAALHFAIPTCGAAEESTSPPNFLIFIADDLNKEYYGCYGNENTASPTVSRLAKEGMVFENAFTGQAICATSRSMLYTGKYPLRNGSFMNHTGVYHGTRSVCHYLQAADYDVILCGKSHVKPASAFPWTATMQAESPSGDPNMYTRPAMPVDKLDAYFAANNQQDRRSFCVMASSYYPHGEHPTKTIFSPDSVELTRFQKDSAKTREQEAQFNQAIKNSDDEFANDVGLLWEGGGLDTEFGGEQAEDAEFSVAKKSTVGKNYNGSGYLDMGKEKGAYVHWYRENDGDTANVDLVIRYSAAPKDRKPLQIQLNVNENTMVKKLSLPPTANWGKNWRTTTQPITLKRGANTIRLTTVDDRGLFIDEIEIK